MDENTEKYLIERDDSKRLGMLTHLSGLIGSFFPPANLVIPLIIWLMKKDEMPFVDEAGKEVINFQISMIIYYAIATVLCFLLIGFLIFPVLWVFSFVVSLIGTLRANDGISYKYPMCIKFL